MHCEVDFSVSVCTEKDSSCSNTPLKETKKQLPLLKKSSIFNGTETWLRGQMTSCSDMYSNQEDNFCEYVFGCGVLKKSSTVLDFHCTEVGFWLVFIRAQNSS